MIQLNPNRKIENINPDATPKTATNEFTTLDGGLVSALTVEFAPIQDLHGYSKPWAGGAGKNLCTYNGTNNRVIGHCENGVVYTFSCKYIESSGANLKKNDSSGATITVVTGSAGQTSVYTFVADEDFDLFLNGHSGFTTKVIELQLEKGSTATSYESYSNICPISGHTQVQSKINNTTNTTSLGDTYYGGEVDQVGGTGEQIYDIVDLGDLNWSYEASWGAGSDFYTSGLASLAKLPLTDDEKGNILCTQYENKSRNDFYNSAESAVTLLRGGVLKVRDSRYSDTATFKTAMAGVKVVYELATPTTLSLTGQNITADVGVNEVSAPLTNQNIQTDGVTYKEMFSWQDVVDYVQSQVNP